MANGEKGKGRSQNQQLKLFYLLDYLLEETDETHTKKVQEIIEDRTENTVYNIWWQ